MGIYATASVLIAVAVVIICNVLANVDFIMVLFACTALLPVVEA